MGNISVNTIFCFGALCMEIHAIKGDLQTIVRFSYLKVYELINIGMKFKNL